MLSGRYRLTLKVERAVGRHEARPRMDVIKDSLTAQVMDDRIDWPTFEHRLGRALEREG